MGTQRADTGHTGTPGSRTVTWEVRRQLGVHGSSEPKAALGIGLSALAVISILRKTLSFLPGPRRPLEEGLFAARSAPEDAFVTGDCANPCLPHLRDMIYPLDWPSRAFSKLSKCGCC